MKRTNGRLILLVFDVIAGIVIGARFLYVSQWHYPIQIVIGIICFLAAASAVVSYRLYRSEKTGRLYTVVTVTAVLFNLPVVFYAMVWILVEIVPPQPY